MHWSKLQNIFTPLNEVEALSKERFADEQLKYKVSEYLNGDFPPYIGERVVLYLSRHVATPNLETIRIAHILASLGTLIGGRAVIGQDSKDKFVSRNMLKRILGRMTVILGPLKYREMSKRVVRKFTIIDFDKAEGRKLKDIKTLWGEGLMEFHNRLFRENVGVPVSLFDDADWIDRNQRGKLIEHYERQFALCIAHEIYFEYYPQDDEREVEFQKEVVIPAFEATVARFGVRPIVVNLDQHFISDDDFWLSYSWQVGELIEKSLSNKES